MKYKVFKNREGFLTVVESEDNLKMVAMKDYGNTLVGEVDSSDYKNKDEMVAKIMEKFLV